MREIVRGHGDEGCRVCTVQYTMEMDRMRGTGVMVVYLHSFPEFVPGG